MSYSVGEITAIILFFIGVYGVIARRNIIKTVMFYLFGLEITMYHRRIHFTRSMSA